jgi:arylsulfatase A-like enzyme
MRILYVDIDTLRPDHLGCYGYGRNTSPNIDRVAEEGVRFTDYYCSDAPCLPSRAALMTGRFGIHNGCVNHGGENAEMRHEGPMRGMADFNGRYNLPAVMRRAGMKTASISSFPDRHAAWWFQGGFDECYNVGKRGLEPADDVLPIALDWLDRKKDLTDWFLHVHLWDPHIPYRTPMEYGNPFEKEPLPDNWMTQEILDYHHKCIPGGHSSLEVSGYSDTPNPNEPRQPRAVKTLDDFRWMVDEYDTGIWYADRMINQVFDKLKEQGIYEDTVIIISSDHGEDLGELGSYCEHGAADYITTHIPLIIKWPGCAKGTVSSGLHYNVDLLPTLMDLLGGVPEFKCNRVVGLPNPVRYDGESFADCVRTGADGGRDFLVVSQMAHISQRSVRFGDWLYIRTYHDGYRLYDEDMLFNVAQDPHETKNLAQEQPELCWKGAYLLEHWVADNMLSNIDHSCVDPLWQSIAEGGPFHCRGHLPTYVQRLKDTGRGDLAERLIQRHPNDMKISY